MKIGQNFNLFQDFVKGVKLIQFVEELSRNEAADYL